MTPDAFPRFPNGRQVTLEDESIVTKIFSQQVYNLWSYWETWDIATKLPGSPLLVAPDPGRSLSDVSQVSMYSASPILVKCASNRAGTPSDE